jgi:hypothetical protein
MYIESRIPPGALYGSSPPTQGPHPCTGLRVRGEERACPTLRRVTPTATRLDRLCYVCIEQCSADSLKDVSDLLCVKQ